MISRIFLYVILNVINNFSYLHYNRPPNKPPIPPTTAPGAPPNDPPNKAPPIAVENGLACTCCCAVVTGKPDAIGEAKLAYCCNA